MKFTFRKPKHMKSKIAKIGIAITGLVGGLAGTFFLVPNKTSLVDLGMPTEEPAKEETYFSKFVSKFTRASELTPEEIVYPTISADFKDFSVSWLNNEIELEGNLKLSIKNLNDISLSLDVDASYNSKKVDFALALTNKTVYLALDDLRLKQSFVETNDQGINEFAKVLDNAYQMFFDQSNENGLRINFSLEELVTSLVGGADLGSLLSGSGIGLDVIEEETDENVNITLNVSMAGEEGQDPTEMSILIELGKENLDLRKVDLGTIQLGGVTIKGGLDVETSDEIKILGLDDPNYPKQRGEFTEIINYSRWIDKVFNLLSTRQIGLDVSANLKMNGENLGYADIAADLDASELFDLTDLDLLGIINGNTTIDSIFLPDGVEDSENEITGLLNKFDFNVGVKLGNIKDSIKEEYSNINLAYYTNDEGHNAGYLSFNEQNDDAVMRAKIDVQTINYLISKVPELIDSIQGKEITKSTAQDDEVGFFDFITSSELVTAIKDGRYDGIIDVLENIKSTAKTIEITLNLSYLGFGDNAKIFIILDANEDGDTPTNIISIEAKNIKLNDLELDARIATRPYSSSGLEKVDAIADKYDSLDFVSGMFDQVQNIVNTKQAGFKLSGSILDDQNLGFDFGGWAQLDYGKKEGIGSIKFNQYKEQTGVISNDHQVDLSITDFDEDRANNNMLFEYSNPTLASKNGNPAPLRGKFTLKTFDDIIDLVMELIEQQDRRFMKFLDDILEEIRNSLIMKILSSKDYLELTKSSYITSIKQTSDGKFLDIYISEKLIPMNLVETPIHLQIEFGKDSLNQRNLKTVKVVDLDIGDSLVNLDIDLVDYVEGRENPVDINEEFMNFSDIAVLLEFGINTTELNYFHLSGNASISALAGVINLSFGLDFHVYVKDETTKVYGKIIDIPVIGDVLGLCDVNTEFVFEPDHNASDNDIGGYFYILRSEDRLIDSKDKQFYYKSDSKNFLDKILTYIVSSCLGISADLVDDLGDLDLGNGGVVNPLYQNMFPENGFAYTHSSTQDVWNIGLDLGVITGNDSFSTLTAEITGKEVAGKGYFTGLTAKTTLAKVVNATVKLSLIDPNPEIEDWPASIETRYQRIAGYFATLSQANQTKCYNNPASAYECKLGTI